MSEEVTNPHGLGYRQQEDAATLAAWQEGMSLEDKTVYDVNGLEMGKVSRAFAEEGTLTRIDVKLSRQARQMFGTMQETTGVPPIAVADVTDDSVKLNEAAEQILHPEGPAGTFQRGAEELPRKER